MAEDKNKNIHEGHRARLRERMNLDPNMTNFQDHELLEILLMASIKQGNTNDIAHSLINRFGKLSNVFSAPIDELKQVPGVGDAVAMQLKCQGALFRAYLQDKYCVLNKTYGDDDLYQAIMAIFACYPYEMLYCFCLDSKNNIISKHKLTEGISNRASLDMLTLSRIAILNNATSIMLAHNHPSGTLKPSNEDLRLTKYVSDRLDAIGVKLIEHVIVAGSQVFQIMSSKEYEEFLNKY